MTLDLALLAWLDGGGRCRCVCLEAWSVGVVQYRYLVAVTAASVQQRPATTQSSTVSAASASASASRVSVVWRCLDTTSPPTPPSLTSLSSLVCSRQLSPRYPLPSAQCSVLFTQCQCLPLGCVDTCNYYELPAFSSSLSLSLYCSLSPLYCLLSLPSRRCFSLNLRLAVVALPLPRPLSLLRLVPTPSAFFGVTPRRRLCGTRCQVCLSLAAYCPGLPALLLFSTAFRSLLSPTGLSRSLLVLSRCLVVYYWF